MRHGAHSHAPSLQFATVQSTPLDAAGFPLSLPAWGCVCVLHIGAGRHSISGGKRCVTSRAAAAVKSCPRACCCWTPCCSMQCTPSGTQLLHLGCLVVCLICAGLHEAEVLNHSSAHLQSFRLGPRCHHRFTTAASQHWLTFGISIDWLAEVNTSPVLLPPQGCVFGGGGSTADVPAAWPRHVVG